MLLFGSCRQCDGLSREGVVRLQGYLDDLRLAYRAILRRPRYAATLVACLGAGVGVAALAASLIDAVFFRAPSGVRESEQLRRIYFQRSWPRFGVVVSSATSYPLFLALKRNVPAYQSVGAFTTGLTESLGLGLDAEAVQVQFASASYFQALSTTPTVGRFYSEDEDAVGGPAEAVISHGFWQRHFGGRPDVVGAPLLLGHRSYIVIGVAGPGFSGATFEPIDIWLPLATSAADFHDARWLSHAQNWLEVVARIKPSVGDKAVAAASGRTLRDALASSGAGADSTAGVVLGPLQEARGPAAPRATRVLRWVGLAGLLGLLIALSNATNLMLVRALQREHEIAIRAALGASEFRIVRPMICEGAIVALASAACALAVVFWVGPTALRFLLPTIPPDFTLLGPRLVVVTLGIAVASGVVISFFAARTATRRDLTRSLRASGAAVSGRQGKLRMILVVAQMALTVVLLGVAGLLLQSLHKATSINLGYEADGLILVSFDPTPGPYANERLSVLRMEAMAQLARVPGVSSAAASVGGPFGWNLTATLRVPGLDSLPSTAGGPYYQLVTRDYFKTMHGPVQGRDFADGDYTAAPATVIVDRTMANALWPSQDPLGKCIVTAFGPSCATVVGIVADAHRFSAVEAGTMQYYLPYSAGASTVSGLPITNLMVRTTGHAAALVPAIQRAVQAMAPDLPVVQVTPVDQLLEPSLRPWKVGAVMFSAVAVLALGLAALGLYGVVSYSVSQQTAEIGTRLALGGTPATVVREVVWRGVRLAAVGSVFGLIGALALGKALSALLYEVSWFSPFEIGTAVLVLLLVGVAASYIPARAAAKVDPSVALRVE